MNSSICICIVVGLIFLAADVANGSEPILSPFARVTDVTHVAGQIISMAHSHL